MNNQINFTALHGIQISIRLMYLTVIGWMKQTTPHCIPYITDVCAALTNALHVIQCGPHGRHYVQSCFQYIISLLIKATDHRTTLLRPPVIWTNQIKPSLSPWPLIDLFISFDLRQMRKADECGASQAVWVGYRQQWFCCCCCVGGGSAFRVTSVHAGNVSKWKKYDFINQRIGCPTALSRWESQRPAWICRLKMFTNHEYLVFKKANSVET